MNTLVQQNNSFPHLQLATMNSGEVGLRQQRPTNNPSKNLHSNELQSLYSILGENCVVRTIKMRSFEC